MAVLADIGRIDVRRVFAGCFGTVVATKAIAGDVGVVEVGWRPGNCGVAVVAGVTAQDMCRVLARGGDAVMAG